MEIDRNNLDLDRKFPQQQSLKKILYSENYKRIVYNKIINKNTNTQ
jgi:hypothetical protein